MSFQDYTTYTETDPNNRFDPVTANKIIVNDLSENEDAYIYDDKGSAFFNGNFVHNVDLKTGTVSAGTATFSSWTLANDIDDMQGLFDGAKSCFLLQTLKDTVTTEQVYLIERDGATGYSDFATLANYSGQYYYTLERDLEVGTYGTLYCYIYTDSARTVLEDTLSIALHSSKKDFQYVYAVQSRNLALADNIDAVIENLDLFVIINTGYTTTPLKTPQISPLKSPPIRKQVG